VVIDEVLVHSGSIQIKKKNTKAGFKTNSATVFFLRFGLNLLYWVLLNIYLNRSVYESYKEITKSKILLRECHKSSPEIFSGLWQWAKAAGRGRTRSEVKE